MSILQSYPKGTPKADDLLLGTKTPLANTNDLPVTQNFSISDVASFANSYSLGYTLYTALITQAGVATPTAKILQNTTGATLTWGRTSAGIFTLTSNAAIFTADKTIVFANCGNDSSSNADPAIIWARTSSTVLTITASAGIDSVLTDGAFEVRIYS